MPITTYLLTNYNAACGTVGNLYQIDARGGHRNGLFGGSVGTLCHEAADYVEDADGLLFGSAHHDVVVLGEDDDVVGNHIADANVLSKVADDVGGGFAEDDGDGFAKCGVGIGVYAVPVVEVVAIVGNGGECHGVAYVALVAVGGLTVDEDIAPVGDVDGDVERCLKQHLVEDCDEDNIGGAHLEGDVGFGVNDVVVGIDPADKLEQVVGCGSDGDVFAFVVDAGTGDRATTSGAEGDGVVRQDTEDGGVGGVVSDRDGTGEVGVAVAPLEQVVVLGGSE